MKYFTYELLSTMNNESYSVGQIAAAENQWKQNSTLYAIKFNDLFNRLPTEIYTRFKGYGFHDYSLKEVIMNHTSLLNITIVLILESDNDLWKLSFKNVSDISFFHHNKDNPQPVFEPTLDLWLHEEFLVLDEKTLSFEVLLYSGANIKLYFKDSAISLEKFSKVL